MGSSLFDKIWERHRVREMPDGSTLLYIDRVMLHERTGSIALKGLTEAGRAVRNPAQAFVCMDHIVDTFPGRSDETLMPGGKAFIQETRAAAQAAGLRIYDIGDDRQGIVHVVGPEQGITLPGLTIVCPDSHTCTQGGLGALAWGIGSTEAEHALATQTLTLHKPKSMRVRFEGSLAPGVSAKDLILALIAQYGAGGGSGYAVEFAGSAVQDLSIEGRLTLCNMAVEFAAWSGFIAPDEKAFTYVQGRALAPKGADYDQALAEWRELRSDDDAVFDREIIVNASEVSPRITWGTSPEHGIAIDSVVPDPAADADSNGREAKGRALTYMDLSPGQRLEGLAIDAAFIGSCTNSRLPDLRAAAAILKGRKVAPGVKAICVPGSMQVKAAAEAEGLDLIFKDAGFEWRESGCSMCFFAGGEHFAEKARVVTSTNRNFENRQGPGTRSHLASPATVAASAVAGHLADVRKFLSQA